MPKLTDGKSGSIARAVVPARGTRFVFDDHRDAPRGFGLRVTAAGGKYFVLRYTMDGRQRLKTVGDWPTWTLEAARAEAREIAQGIARGIDPLEAKRRRRADPTLGEFAEEWMDRDLSGLKSGPALRSLIQNDLLPSLRHVKLTALTRRDVLEAVEAKAASAPRQAGLLLIYARRLLDDAANRGLIPVNPAAGLKPAAVKVAGRRNALAPKARLRILDHDELRTFWQLVETSGMHRLTALALKLILLTGQRPGEIAGMHIDEISGRTWTIPSSRRGKTSTPHIVHLTDTALELIEAARAEVERLQQRRRAPWAGYIFETGPEAPLTSAGIARAVERCAAALGAKNVDPWGRWSAHDLRRTMRTGLSACRVRPDIAELVIGHTKRGIVAVYDQHGFEAERRAALEAWECRLLCIIAGKISDASGDRNVVKLGVLKSRE